MGAVIKNTQLSFTSQTRTRPNEFVAADGDTPKLIMDASKWGSQISWIALCNSDAGANRDIIINFFIKDENPDSPRYNILARVHQVVVPAGAGYNGVVNTANGLNSINSSYLPPDSNGWRILNLNYQMNLYASVDSTTPINAGNKIDIVVCAADYDIMDVNVTS